MTGREVPEADPPTLLGEALPLEAEGEADVDALPLDEVRVGSRADGAGGELYWYFVLPGGRQSAVGYRLRDVAIRKGAEALRADRQRRALGNG